MFRKVFHSSRGPRTVKTPQYFIIVCNLDSKLHVLYFDEVRHHKSRDGACIVPNTGFQKLVFPGRRVSVDDRFFYISIYLIRFECSHTHISIFFLKIISDVTGICMFDF